jgi:hypothetical protein
MTNAINPTTTPGAPPSSLPIDDRAYNETLNEIFETFALRDQQAYYERSIERFGKSTRQVNGIRATLAFATGVASALSGLIVQSNLNSCVGPASATTATVANCGIIHVIIAVCVILTVVLPAWAAAFNILSDLYQWDRLISIYRVANENMTFADAQSPLPEMDNGTYHVALNTFVEGTLGVMTDETAQWGQLIRTPPDIDKFLKESEQKASQASKGAFSVSGATDTPPAG